MKGWNKGHIQVMSVTTTVLTTVYIRRKTQLKLNPAMKVLLFASFVTLLSACQLSGLAPAPAQQSPLLQAESPLPFVANREDTTDGYQVLARFEEHRTEADGSTIHSIVENNYYQTPSANQHGYNAHHIITLGNPEAGIQGVMEETYVVDDLVFTYCPSCGFAATGGWDVSNRTMVKEDGVSRAPVELSIGLTPIATLVEQSAVVGTESINGISTTHYRLAPSQLLSDTVRWRIGGQPDARLEIAMAQLEIWLSADEQKPIQYNFAAEGSSEIITGAQVLPPFTFTILDQYSFIETTGDMPITVPPEVLGLVEGQIKALEDR